MGSLLNRRRYMGGGGGEEPLPQGGVRIEYLRFTGTQYIDTGFIPDNNTSISVVATINVKDQFVFGSGVSYRSRAFELYVYGTNTVQVNYGSFPATQALHYTSGNKYLISLDKNVLEAYNMQGEFLEGYTFPELTFTCPSTLLIGALHRGDNVILNTKTFDLGNVIIKDNGTVVRNYIPARIGQVGYLYNTISQKYYGNENDTDFVLGPDI